VAWLALGTFLLFAAVGASFRAPRAVDSVSAIAVALLVGALLQSFQVYPMERALVAMAGGMAGAVMVTSFRSPDRRSVRILALSAGAVSCLFALFGPAGGLF